MGENHQAFYAYESLEVLTLGRITMLLLHHLKDSRMLSHIKRNATTAMFLEEEKLRIQKIHSQLLPSSTFQIILIQSQKNKTQVDKMHELIST